MQIVKANVMEEAAKNSALGCLVFASMTNVHALLDQDTQLPKPWQIQLVPLMKIAQSFVLQIAISEAASRKSVNVDVMDNQWSILLFCCGCRVTDKCGLMRVQLWLGCLRGTKIRYVVRAIVLVDHNFKPFLNKKEVDVEWVHFYVFSSYQ